MALSAKEVWDVDGVRVLTVVWFFHLVTTGEVVEKIVLVTSGGYSVTTVVSVVFTLLILVQDPSLSRALNSGGGVLG